MGLLKVKEKRISTGEVLEVFAQVRDCEKVLVDMKGCINFKEILRERES